MDYAEGIELVNAGAGAMRAIQNPISHLLEARNEKYKRADDHLARVLAENGFITEEDECIAAKMLLIPKMHRRLRNLARVLKRADALYINEANPAADNLNMPSDDWMDYFIDKASGISDEDVQGIWATILARECEYVGTFRKVMLDRMALLDKETATAFRDLCGLSYTVKLSNGDSYLVPMYLRDDELVRLVEENDCDYDEAYANAYQVCRPRENDLQMLQEIGLVKLSEPFDEGEIFEPESFGYELVLNGDVIYRSRSFAEEGSEWHNFIPTGAARFTHIGALLCKAISSSLEPPDPLHVLILAYYRFQESLRS